MLDLYHAVISTPLLNILIFLYNTVAVQDLGLAIAGLTILVRLAFYPLFQRGLEQQAKMQQIQPKIKEIQKKHKGNHEAHSKALLALYKEEKFNPFSGIFMMLIQIPILLALYYLFMGIFSADALASVYGFIHNPGTLNHVTLGLIDLAQPNFPLVVVTALLQFAQTRIALSSMKNADKAQRMTGQIMSLAAPVITLVISYLPAAVSVYWLFSSLISVGQQYLAKSKISRKDVAAA
jgi:YidC/Oxa1 family membrane protein insertase